MDRRQFLKASAAIGLGLAAPTSLRLSSFRRSYAEVGITRFVDPLVKPPVLAPLPQKIKGATAYTVYATQALHAFSRDSGNSLLNKVPAWAYSPTPAPTRFVDAVDFHYLGPTIEAYYLEKVSFEVVNQLPSEHLFSIDYALHGPDHYADDSRPRIITHLHGGKVSPEADGYPEDHYPPGGRLRVDYPNKQRAANIWYHDHSLGITRLNVAAGLAAFYFIRDDFELSLGLPSGDYELPIVIQDRTFVEGGPYGAKLFYLPEWEEEYFAETIVVNGRVWPFQAVEPRKYRLRLLNGSNARSYRLWLEDEEGTKIPWTQIGNSGGLLPAAIVPAGEITLAPAERADVIVDFAGLDDKTITMKNNAGAPFFHKGTTLDYIAGLPGEDPVNNDLTDIMQFKVDLLLAGTDNSASPAGPILLLDPVPPTAVSDVRDFVFEPQEEEFDYPLIPDSGEHFPIPKGFRLVIHSMQQGWYQNYLNDIANDIAKGTELADWRNYSIGFMWDHISDQVQRGSKCQWTFWNITADMHPMHMHLVNFEVNGRQVLAGNGKLPILAPDGDPAANDPAYVPPYIVSPTVIDANELGTRDTVKMYPGHATTIIFQVREFVGLYPFHCHIIDHEDHEMMRQYEIITGKPKSKSVG